MTETWIPWAVKAPGPANGYTGYTNKPARTLEEIVYIVNHSAEGWLAYLIQGHRPGQPASWTFSVALGGTLYQHYPLEAITYTSGGFIPNLRGIGVEHEGIRPFAFTDEQAITDVRLYLALEALCPNLGAPVLGAGLEEHRRVAPGSTTCPNGRTRYDKYKLIGQEEDVMPALTEAEQRRVLAFVDYCNTIPGGLKGALEKIAAKLGVTLGN